MSDIDRQAHDAISAEVFAGRVKAHAKRGVNSIEAIPGDDPRWLSILMEEVGETAHELTYDPTGDLRAELIDVITVATAWVAAIDAPQEPDYCGEKSEFGECHRKREHPSGVHATSISIGTDPFSDPDMWFAWTDDGSPLGYRSATAPIEPKGAR